jgi:hypothetical protein
MATQIKTKNRDSMAERIIYLSKEEAIGIIHNLINLITDTGARGIDNTVVYCEDDKEIPYRLYLIPKKESA